MPRPYNQDPENYPWNMPLPGPYDPNAPTQPGQTTVSNPGGGGRGGAPLPSSPVSPIGGMPPAMSSWTTAAGEGGNALWQALSQLAGSGGGKGWLDLLAKFAVPAGLMGLGQVLGPDQPELPPELHDILAIQKQRLEAQNPLYASVLQSAQSRMPISAQGAQLPAGTGLAGPASRNPAQQAAVQELARRRG